MDSSFVWLEEYLARSSELFCVLSLEGQFIYSNPSCSRWFQESDTSILKHSIFLHLEPHLTESLRSALQQCQTYPQEHPIELSYLFPGETHRRVLALQLTYLPSRKSVVASGRDCTLRTQQHTELLGELKRFEDFVECASDTFIMHSMDGRIIDANREACRVLGYTREELLQLHVSDIELTVKKGVPSGIWHRMSPGVPITVEGRHKRKDGVTFPVEVRLGLFGVEDDLLMLALCRDISERKRRQKAIQMAHEELRHARDKALSASQAKSVFLASMSHELRTPLNAIIGYTEMIEEELRALGCEESVQDAEKVLLSSKHLLHLINDLLDLSKIEAGKFELLWESFDIQEFIEEVVQLTAPLFQSTHNTFQLKLPTNRTLGALYADRTKLSQALINLLSNANKFTAEGRVSLSVQRIRQEREWILFRVEDKGIGIEPEQLEHIFEPFVQAQSTIRSQYGGTGLGLAISQRLCRMMGGEILAESQLGVGSAFTIRLPISAELSTETPEESISHASLAALRPIDMDTPIRRVQEDMSRASLLLVIDEEPETYQLCIRYLLSEGIIVKSAFHHREGISFARALRPQCIVFGLDLSLPENRMTLQELRDESTLQETGLIVYTANAKWSQRMQKGQRHAEVWLSKSSVDAERLLISCLREEIT